MHHSPAFTRLFKGLGAALLLLAASTLGAAAQGAFYTADSTAIAGGKPGSLIRSEKLDILPFDATKYKRPLPLGRSQGRADRGLRHGLRSSRTGA
ncbi:MAG: hypothetical protein WDN31_11380 [Hyphomicrobium sp.]